MRFSLIVVALAVSVSACHPRPSAIALQGAAAEIAALQGEWTGEYQGVESGRSGSITLRITTSRDTAYGDVLMTSPGGQRLVAADPRQNVARLSSGEVLRIALVRVAAGQVSGALEPYVDPSCSCTVTTTFTGTVSGNAIEGTFVTRGRGDSPQGGRWRVTRRS